ncbi:MAG TPA: pentapeptide repeat-containing protein [Candidatus Baltobacteraceae bacterium]|nr:pentapeptide repeat-containing protein [Candidatus Baltobacteraceae bacterium]
MNPSLFDLIARGALVVLVNSLWQGIAIAGLTWLALHVFRKVNASTRYAAWTLALAAVVVIPVVTSVTHIVYERASAPAAAPVPTQTVSTHAAAPAHAAAPSFAPAAKTIALPSAPRVTVNPPSIATAALFGLWVLAALALVARLVVALTRLERLKRDSLPLGLEYRDKLVQWQRLSSRDRDVRICVTDATEVPVAVGLFDAMVLLPQHLLDRLGPDEIDQISLHELAHLLRHDDWTNGFQRVITALLFFNPAVWFIARQMDVEREVACDDYVLELTGAVRSYAFCLTKMAEMTAWPHQPLAAPGVFTTRKNISIRIERLLRTGRAIGSSISPATGVAVAIGLIAGYVLARAFTPVVAFALPALPAIASAPLKPLPHPAVTAKAPRVAAEVMASPRPRKRPEVVMTTRPLTVTMPATGYTVPKITITVPSVKVTVPHVRVAAADVTKGFNCSGCDFSKQSLAGKNFAGSNLSGTDFSHSDLRGANFDGANLSGADFEDADLRNASLVGADLSGTNLDHARLEGANFDDANLSGADLDPRSLSPSQLRAYLPHCRGCDLERTNLSGVDLSGIHLTGVDLRHADLRGANLSNAVFNGVDFSEADLRGALTKGTQFIGCDFSGARLGNP